MEQEAVEAVFARPSDDFFDQQTGQVPPFARALR
jgi:hypothetical protein